MPEKGLLQFGEVGTVSYQAGEGREFSGCRGEVASDQAKETTRSKAQQSQYTGPPLERVLPLVEVRINLSYTDTHAVTEGTAPAAAQNRGHEPRRIRVRVPPPER